jgi:type IV secretory pathway TraG/TraD family ATPase VirD4
MIPILDNINIIVNHLASLRTNAGELHHARFARAHELKALTTHTLDEEALLLGRTNFGGIYRVRKTPKRRELGHLLVVAPPRSGKSILAVGQILSWPAGASLIIVDIKGELYRQTAGYRASLGPVYVLDPRGLEAVLKLLSQCFQWHICFKSDSQCETDLELKAP